MDGLRAAVRAGIQAAVAATAPAIFSAVAAVPEHCRQAGQLCWQPPPQLFVEHAAEGLQVSKMVGHGDIRHREQ
jgi:hypothetical protein